MKKILITMAAALFILNAKGATTHLSIGGEAAWYVEYQDSSSGVDKQSTLTGTETRLIARFYF